MSWKTEKLQLREAIAWEMLDCPICKTHHFVELFKKEGEPISKCKDCGFIMINPRPSYEQILQTYEPRYSQAYSNKQASKRRRSAHWANQARRFVSSGRWLDIGCSSGYMVEAAKNANFDAHGVDLESWGIEYAKKELGLEKIFLGQLEDQKFPANHFQVISAYEVIEHVPDLHRFVGEIKRLLAPDGILVIHTPDVGHWRRTRPLQNWGAVLPSEHLYYFNKKTLGLLLEQHGLIVKKWGFNLKPGLRAYIGHAHN